MRIISTIQTVGEGESAMIMDKAMPSLPKALPRFAPKPVLASAVMGVNRGYFDILPKFVDDTYERSQIRYFRALTRQEVDAPLIRFATELSKQPSLNGVSPAALLPLVRKLAAYVERLGPVIENYKQDPANVEAGMALKELAKNATSFADGWINELISLREGYARATRTTSAAMTTNSVVTPDTTPTKTNPLTFAAIGLVALKLLAVI